MQAHPSPGVSMGYSFSTSLRFIAALALAGGGCVGEFSLRPEEEVTAGEAAGFDYIGYVALVGPDVPEYDQEVFEIESDGRTTLGFTEFDNSQVIATYIRFLPDAELFRVRTNFAESNFFDADSGYVDTTAVQSQVTLFYQVGGRNHQITRYRDPGAGRDPLPPNIAVLFDQVERLVGESRTFGQGDEVPLRPLVSGQTTRIDRRQFEVVKTRDGLLDLLWRMGSIEVSVLPNIDFSAEMVVCAFLGSRLEHRPQGGDPGRTGAIAFSRAYRHDGAIQVEFVRRDYDGPCDDPVQPFALARIPRSDLPVRFFEANDPGVPISCGP